jgi:outer membrane protein insertion porin family
MAIDCEGVMGDASNPHGVCGMMHERFWSLCLLGLSIGVLASQGLALAEQTTVSEIENTLDKGPQTTAETPIYDKSITVKAISIQGNALVPEERIRNVMTIRPGTVYGKKALQDDLRRIYNLGYFTENMKAIPRATREGILIDITLEENAPVTGVIIQGNKALTDAEIEALFSKQIGMPQNIDLLNEGIESLEAKYAEKGFVLAKVTNITDLPNGTVQLDMGEGVIDSIKVVGNRKTKDFVITRNLVLKEGDAYNEETMTNDLKRLYSLQAFDDVRRTITPSAENPDHYDVVVEIDEKRSGAFSLGGGIDTVTGFFGSAGYSDPNFLGRGENFNVQFGVGSGVLGRDDRTQADARTYQFDAGWSTPYLAGSDNAFGVNLFGRDLGSFNVPLALERRIGGGANISRAIEKYDNVSASLGLKVENVNLREGADQSDLNFFGISNALRQRQLEQDGTFISLGPTVAFDTRDNRFEPTTGWFNSASLGGTLGLSADSYGTASLNLRKYFKLNDYITLALNGQGGAGLFNDIPDFNAYRLGGVYSIRGYQEGGLGVGSGYALGTAEVRSKIPLFGKMKDVKFFDSVRVAAFADTGTLFNESEINDVFGRRGYGSSVGAGLRMTIPGLGPLRFDYAVPLVTTRSDYRQNFSFGVGNKF